MNRKKKELHDMKLVFHGGKCCGIKTIYDLGFEPSFEDYGVDKKKAVNHDKYGNTVRSDLEFFTDEAPNEPLKDRLKRLIEFVKKKRPSGIVEVVLQKGRFADQVTPWEPILLSHGFKLVNRFPNSNSSNDIYIYHLNLWDGKWKRDRTYRFDGMLDPATGEEVETEVGKDD